jgi:hypothetical protein
MLYTALNAAEANSCLAMYPYRLPMGAPWTKHPCLELYRERETFGSLGNNTNRVRTVTVAINYSAGPSGSDQDKLGGWGGTLVSRVQTIDDTIEAGLYATYHGGDNLYEMAGIERISLDTAEYDWAESGGPTDSAHPAAQLTVTMVHRYVRVTAGNEPLARIDGSVIGAGWQSGITSGDISADTSVQDGDNGRVVAATKNFTSATASFPASLVGTTPWYIRIADATNPGNDGSHLITARLSGTSLTLGNATTLVNEGPGLHWVLVESP